MAVTFFLKRMREIPKNRPLPLYWSPRSNSRTPAGGTSDFLTVAVELPDVAGDDFIVGDDAFLVAVDDLTVGVETSGRRRRRFYRWR